MHQQSEGGSAPGPTVRAVRGMTRELIALPSHPPGVIWPVMSLAEKKHPARTIWLTISVVSAPQRIRGRDVTWVERRPHKQGRCYFPVGRIQPTTSRRKAGPASSYALKGFRPAYHQWARLVKVKRTHWTVMRCRPDTTDLT